MDRVASNRSLDVEGGYYYRVRCTHAANSDMSSSFTDGIYIEEPQESFRWGSEQEGKIYQLTEKQKTKNKETNKNKSQLKKIMLRQSGRLWEAPFAVRFKGMKTINLISTLH